MIWWKYQPIEPQYMPQNEPVPDLSFYNLLEPQGKIMKLSYKMLFGVLSEQSPLRLLIVHSFASGH